MTVATEDRATTEFNTIKRLAPVKRLLAAAPGMEFEAIIDFLRQEGFFLLAAEGDDEMEVFLPGDEILKAARAIVRHQISQDLEAAVDQRLQEIGFLGSDETPEDQPPRRRRRTADTGAGKRARRTTRQAKAEQPAEEPAGEEGEGGGLPAKVRTFARPNAYQARIQSFLVQGIGQLSREGQVAALREIVEKTDLGNTYMKALLRGYSSKERPTRRANLWDKASEMLSALLVEEPEATAS